MSGKTRLETDGTLALQSVVAPLAVKLTHHQLPTGAKRRQNRTRSEDFRPGVRSSISSTLKGNVGFSFLHQGILRDLG